MKISKKSIKAFSLIELSIVLLIIGIIIAGVTQGGRIISAMKLATAKSITQSSSVPSIKGLIMWLEPTLDNSFLDAESENGQEITVWKDVNPQSSIKLNASASGATTGLTYDARTVSGLPSIKFSGTTAKILTASPIASGYASTVFIVYKVTGGNPNEYIYSWDSAYIRSSVGGGEGDRYVGTSVSWIAQGSTDFTTQPEIATIALTGPLSSNTITLYVNGTNVLDRYALGAAAISATANFKIGAGPVAVSQVYYSGYISEVIVFEGVLKTEDRKEVESYLGKKYGIKVN